MKDSHRNLCLAVQANPGATFDDLADVMCQKPDAIRKKALLLIEMGMLRADRKARAQKTRLYRTDKPLGEAAQFQISAYAAKRYAEAQARLQRPPVPDLAHLMPDFVRESLRSTSTQEQSC